MIRTTSTPARRGWTWGKPPRHRRLVHHAYGAASGHREEFDDFGRSVLAAFHRELTEEDSRHYERIDEPERSLAWFDDGRLGRRHRRSTAAT